MDSGDKSDIQVEPSATTSVFSAIAVAVICICISAVAVFVISSEKKVHDARKALISSIEDRASRGAVQTGIPVIETEAVDQLRQFTVCRNGWCVTDSVPVDPASLQTPSGASISQVDLAAVAKVVCTGDEISAEHRDFCSSVGVP